MPTPASQDGLDATPEQFAKIYSGLPGTEALIRLIHLGPGEPGDEIVCDLVSADLNTAPEYEAISYTWGEKGLMRPIRLNGQLVAIRDHLWQLLVEIRDPYVPRIFWVDVLSIRQDDIKDKNDQVLQIGRIFHSAQRVLAWLGPHADDSGSAIRLLKILEKYLRERDPSTSAETVDPEQVKAMYLQAGFSLKDDEYLDLRPWVRQNFVQQFLLKLKTFLGEGYKEPTTPEGAFTNAKFLEPSFPGRDLLASPAGSICVDLFFLARSFDRALHQLWNRSYTQRTWILQELRLAREVIFLCGDTTLPRATFWSGIEQRSGGLFMQHAESVCHATLYAGHSWHNSTSKLEYNARFLIGPVTEVPTGSIYTGVSSKDGGLAESAPRRNVALELLLRALNTSCSEPRDVLFAVRSLLPEQHKLLEVEVNYAVLPVDFLIMILRCYNYGLEPEDAMNTIDTILDLTRRIGVDSENLIAHLCNARMETDIRESRWRFAKAWPDIHSVTFPETISRRRIGHVREAKSVNELGDPPQTPQQSQSNVQYDVFPWRFEKFSGLGHFLKPSTRYNEAVTFYVKGPISVEPMRFLLEVKDMLFLFRPLDEIDGDDTGDIKREGLLVFVGIAVLRSEDEAYVRRIMSYAERFATLRTTTPFVVVQGRRYLGLLSVCQFALIYGLWQADQYYRR